MFVENIVRYNFDPTTEYELYKEYAKRLGDGWYIEDMGTKCISLVRYHTTFYDTSDMLEHLRKVSEENG